MCKVVSLNYQLIVVQFGVLLQQSFFFVGKKGKMGKMNCFCQCSRLKRPLKHRQCHIHNDISEQINCQRHFERSIRETWCDFNPV